MNGDEEVDGGAAIVIDAGAMGALVKSEVEAQLTAAHRYPRTIKKFLDEAKTLATLTEEIAEDCMYTLKRRERNPRTGEDEVKLITGPSVRLAEIVASSYGNLHAVTRIVAVEEKVVVAQGIAWDLEKNLKVGVEVRRRITTSKDKRYGDDMIGVTGAAAGAIGLRNAIFTVVPRAYVRVIYDAAREVAVGNAKTLGTKRERLFVKLEKMGVSMERALSAVGKKAIEDVGLEEVELLIGLGVAVKNGEQAIDEAFPIPGAKPAEEGSLENAVAQRQAARDVPSANTSSGAPGPSTATAPTPTGTPVVTPPPTEGKPAKAGPAPKPGSTEALFGSDKTSDAPTDEPPVMIETRAAIAACTTQAALAKMVRGVVDLAQSKRILAQQRLLLMQVIAAREAELKGEADSEPPADVELTE
jgi:hypothetical protein